MLILMRAEGESIVITLPDGREVWVMVTRIKEGRVRVGIDAPADVSVDREEIRDREAQSQARVASEGLTAGG